MTRVPLNAAKYKIIPCRVIFKSEHLKKRPELGPGQLYKKRHFDFDENYRVIFTKNQLDKNELYVGLVVPKIFYPIYGLYPDSDFGTATTNYM